MKHPKSRSLPQVLAAVTLMLGAGPALAALSDAQLESTVSAAIGPLMQQQAIAGMAVALSVEGKQHYFNYGVASRQTAQPLTTDTLFEIGSVSKTFTATLAAYAQANGALSLGDPASKHWPALKGTAFDGITLLNLGTYTAGGLPLQFPDTVKDPAGLLDYYSHWKADYAPGTHRLYSNPSLGLFGYLAARSLNAPFADLMQKQLLPQLGLQHTFVQVPAEQTSHYAQGYDKNDQPVRVGPGPLDAEAYGLKTTSADLLHYLELNMRPKAQGPVLERALAITQTGYYQVGEMIQGLGWEMYRYPVSLDHLLKGNTTEMALEPQPVAWLNPARPPQPATWLNKTGSTNGFGAYVAFVPSKNIALVMLANRNYPNAERIKAAHAILGAVDR
ncbi:beta-lactamase [Pseudomonas sp. GD03860]|uniref:class C beta-lactamase n=1 Tax=Pseudomonas sp. GD03860 TaxID=2975389 RepID=UPI002448C72B|nr:class C beta-lactamase [Pseudomonas sp. GD03860]MDH0636929.1 beta-lactamase [Pseudomonas sp. GD03860]